MKNILLILSILFTALISQAQVKITVEESSQTVNGLVRKGQQVVIALDQKSVENEWAKQLKTYGKVDASKGVYTVTSAMVPAVSGLPCIIYSVVLASNNGVKIWWTIDLGSHLVTPLTHPKEYKAMEKVLHDFAARMYTNDVNEQITAAEKALSISVKNQDKTVQKGQQLVQDIESNKQEKANLEQKLKDNASELVQLQQSVEQNKGDQQKATSDVSQMQKALEVVKAKLSQIQ